MAANHRDGGESLMVVTTLLHHHVISVVDANSQPFSSQKLSLIPSYSCHRRLLY